MTETRTPVPQTYIVQLVATITENEQHFQCFPEKIWVGDGPGVLIFQMVDPTDPALQFALPTISPAGKSQFDAGVVSNDGRLMVLCDIDSLAGPYSVLLNITHPSGKVYSFDPEVINRPASTIQTA